MRVVRDKQWSATEEYPKGPPLGGSLSSLFVHLNKPFQAPVTICVSVYPFEWRRKGDGLSDLSALDPRSCTEAGPGIAH